MTSPSLPASASATAVGNGAVNAQLTVGRPSGVINGDLLLWVSCSYAWSDMTLPAGFTPRLTGQSGSGGFARNLIVATKPITDIDNEPSTYSTNTASDSGATGAVRLYRLVGADPDGPVENGTTASATNDAPDIVSSGGDRLGLVFYAGESSSNVFVPAEVTLLNQAASADGYDSSPNSRITVGYKTDLTAGTTVVGSFTGGVGGARVTGSLSLIPAPPPVAATAPSRASNQLSVSL